MFHKSARSDAADPAGQVTYKYRVEYSGLLGRTTKTFDSAEEARALADSLPQNAIPVISAVPA